MSVLDRKAPADRFTVDDYFKLYENGLLAGNRVELIEGRIRKILAQGSDHQRAMTLGSIVLQRHFPSNTHWVVLAGTVKLSKFNAPDPDLSVFNVPLRSPDDKRPLPMLLIEIADTSYAKDRGTKLRMYAKSGIGDYWIVNLKRRRVEVYREPENADGTEQGWEYSNVRHYKPGESIALLARPDVSIAVGELLP